MTRRNRSLSSWWAATSHRSLGATTDLAKKLAIAIVPVRSIIRVVDDHVPAMSVEWSPTELSFTDFKNNNIKINAAPFKEGMPDAKALDISTGFAMHEASHGKHSRVRYQDLIVKDENGDEQFAFTPMRIAAWLWNVVEDVRIEYRTSKEWPGFADYFSALLDWLWDQQDKAPVTSTEEKEESRTPGLDKQLKTVFMANRFYDRWTERLPAEEEPEIEWWHAWQQDYLNEVTDVRETIQRGLDHLRLDEESAKEMDEMAAQEEAERKAGEELREQLDRLMAEGFGKIVICASGGDREASTEVIDAETAKKIAQMVKEGLIEMRVLVTGHGVSNPPMFIRKPLETVASRRSYVGAPDAKADALRTALVFRPSDPEYDVKLLRSGHIDDEELYRWRMKDYRVFSERVIENKPDVFMGLLVDMSGSMYGEKLATAQRLAQLFVWALHDQEGVRTEVWGHTGDESGTATVELYKLWELGDPLTRLGLINTLPHNNNYDGHAIAWCINQMRDAPEEQRVLIVLSDGQPSGQGYGGQPAFTHMRGIVEDARRRLNVEVIQVAIDGALDIEHQRRMFGDAVVPYKTDGDLPKQLARLMGKFA